MSRRTPLAVAVVGALLVGGATTGTTHALWRDQATMSGSGVASGSMSHAVTIDGPSSLGTLSLVPGESPKILDATVLDTSPQAKNLRQAITFAGVDLVDPTPGLSLSQLTMSVGMKTADGCSAPTPSAADGDLTTSLGTTSPGGSLGVCVKIAALTGSPDSTGVLRLEFDGAQVRPDGQQGGWASAASTTVPLTVVGVSSPPAPNGLGCVSWVKGVSATITWTSVPGVTYALVNNGQVKIANITSSMLPLTVRPSEVGGNNVDLKVRATNPAGVSTDSSSTFNIQFQAPKCSAS